MPSEEVVGQPEWRPSQGYVRLQVDNSPEDSFDYDTLKSNPDLELWVFRAPANIGAKHLKDLQLRIPPTPSGSDSVVASLSRKDKRYQVHHLHPSPTSALPDASISSTGTGSRLGEELTSLACLVPRAKKGHLVLAPQPIARHFVISQSPVLPTPAPPENGIDFGPPPPRPQPVHRLVHAFQPVGSLAPPPSDEAEDEDEEAAMDLDSPPKKKRRPNNEATPSSPKKAKKHQAQG